MYHQYVNIVELIDTNRLKNSHFPNYKHLWNKISKFRKMEKWATFLTLCPQGVINNYKPWVG